MWNPIHSFIFWLHEPEHVARFQRSFGVLPIANQAPKTTNESNHITAKLANKLNHRHHQRKVTYDTNVLDECIEEIKHSAQEIDYRITHWLWYYFFQFGSALGNEIFYIVFFPTW